MIPLFLENILIIIAVVGVGCLALYLLSLPFRWFFKWVLNGICGVVILFLLHTVGGGFGLEIPLNAVTIIVSALLGVFGVVLILLKILFL